MCAALEFTSTESDLDNVFSTLVKPSKLKLQRVRSKLSKKTISDDDICRLASIPFPRTITQSGERLEEMMKPTFEWIKNLGRISVEYWEMFKPIRNAYAHNFRFSFFSRLLKHEKREYDSWVIGYVEKGPDVLKDSVLIGEPQRIAMYELGRLLEVLELWIYWNLLNQVLNNGSSVLPEHLYFLTNDEKIAYEKIRAKQMYNEDYTPHRHEGPIHIENQLDLHIRLIKLRNELGPQLRLLIRNGHDVDPLSRY